MSIEQAVYNIFQRISGGYDRANMRISLGQHLRWKRAAVRVTADSVPRGGKVLDICCGTGDISALLLQERDDLRVVGVDFSPNMLDEAKRRLGGEDRLSLLQGDAMELPFEDRSFDGCVISFGLRNTANYERVLIEMARVVRTDGVICCIDSFYPAGWLVRPFYHLYFSLLMPFFGGGLRQWKEYLWLSRSTRSFITPDGLQVMMGEAGIRPVKRISFLMGACVCQTGYKTVEKTGA